MHKVVAVFFYFLLVRVAYVLFSGFSACDLCFDCVWIDMLSERALNGNFDFDIGRFIAAPFYNLFLASHKAVFGDYWRPMLMATQIIISSISGVYFYKLGKLLFTENQATVATILFGVFPMTLYWVYTFCSESLFQSMLIISIYFLVKAVKSQHYRDVSISAILFSLTFLTKSHVLLFSPFIALYLFINMHSIKKWAFPALFGSICLLFTLPFGLYNMRVHDQYVLSSNGSQFHFYTGNSPFGYRSVVDVPAPGTHDYDKLMEPDLAYFNGAIHDELMSKPHKEKQKAYFNLAIKWIKEHPMQFVQLKLYNLALFLMPGVNKHYYPFTSWLLSFLVSLPIYLLGYWGMIQRVRQQPKIHFFALGLWASMVLFSMIWYVQNRFRTITIEPIYLLYAGAMVAPFVERIQHFLQAKFPSWKLLR